MLSTSTDTSTRKDRVTALSIISVSSFISAFSGSAFSVAAPIMTNPEHIQHVPGLDEAGMGWILTIYILATAMLQIPFGKIADNYGRKKIYLIGTIIFSSAALVLGFMNSEITLVIFRFVQGSGAALVFATGMAILTSVFPPEKKGLAFGINIGSVYLGLTIGPSLGAVMIGSWGWRSVFFIQAVSGVILAFMVVFVLKGEWKNEEKEKIDFIGAGIFIVTLFMLIFGFRSINTLYGFYLIGASILTLILFIYWELKVDVPILELKLFKKNRFFTFANLSAFLFYSAMTSTSLLLNYYLQNILYLPIAIAGVVLLARPIAQAILSPIGGKLSDTIEHRTITTIGVATGLLGLILLAFVNQNTHITLVIFGLFLGGIGFGLFSSPNANSIMSSVPRKMYGVASALVGTMRTIGQSISLGFATLLFSAILGTTNRSAGFQFKTELISPILPSGFSLSQHNMLLLQSIKIAFYVSIGMCVLAVIASYLRGKVNFRNNNSTNQKEEISSN